MDCALGLAPRFSVPTLSCAPGLDVTPKQGLAPPRLRGGGPAVDLQLAGSGVALKTA